MKTIILLTLVLSCLVGSQPQRNCSCAAPDPDETTHRGGNEIVTFVESTVYQSIHGIARDVNDEPLEGVLVEIFDRPEWILGNLTVSSSEQHRIAVCKTAADGRFCFENIPPGEYELRGSIGTAWNPSHIYIKVNPNDRRSSRAGIRLLMTVGT